MAGHAQLTFVMTECSKTQIRLTGPICLFVLANFDTESAINTNIFVGSGLIHRVALGNMDRLST